MVLDFKIFVGAHGTAAVVFFAADDMDLTNIKRIGGADDGADIKIVFNILHGDFKGSARFFERGKNLFVGHPLVFIN